jgi:hypothetical protein
MDTPTRSRLLATALAAGALAVAVVAVPVLGQATSPAAEPGAAVAAPPSEKPGKGPKAGKEKVASLPVTLTGTVGTRTDADGKVVYTLAAGGTTYDLQAGPPWFWGDAHPLESLVGSSVTITGEQAEGTTTVDVLTADGKTIREPGRPAWAGGWKAVGKAHPGWAQWKADKAAARDAAKGDRTQGRPSWAGPKTPEASPGS